MTINQSPVKIIATTFLLAASITLAMSAEQGEANLKSAPFIVDSSYLSRHDIVYLAPMQLPAEGFPLGNGNMGGLIWTYDNGVELQINKNDVWSKPEDGASPTMRPNVPRHCARVKIDFGLPVFGWIYTLNNFEGRLSLAKGEATFKAQTGFSSVNVCSWLPQNKNVWVIQCKNKYNDAFVEAGKSLARVELERWGSRAFAGWYSGGFSRNPETGLGSTKSEINGNTILIEETGEGMNFTVACRIINGGRPVRINNHQVDLYCDKPTFTVLISVVTRDESPEPKEAALSLLDQAQRETVPTLKAEKNHWFRRFWSKSFVKLGNDYLENLYYLRRYLMGIGSRGKYPVIFNGGLWRWNRDVINWVTPHHWNTQEQYWGLCAENDCNLMLPYLNTYYRMMLQGGMARLAARRGATNNAILLAEMHNFDGTMVNPDRRDMRYDLTPAAQVALQFWEYEQYTGDREFLKQKAYPFMKRAANFYLETLKWNNEKQCFLLKAKASNYEDGRLWGPVKNPLSDRNCIEALFRSCIQAATILHRDSGLREKWQYVLNHLWKRRLVKQKGFKGEVIAASDTPGKSDTTLWAVGGQIAFPAGIIGIDQKDTPLGKAVMNYIRGLHGYWYSHYPVPIIAARMGAGNQALKLLKNGVETLQFYPQGLMTDETGYPTQLYNLSLKVDLLGGTNHPTIMWRDFFQCGMEPLSILGTAINEMMLQSNESKIRVFPAVPSKWEKSTLAFKLLARGGFLVASERKNGKIIQVSIKSLRGNVCRVENPWAGQTVSVYDYGTKQPLEFKKETSNVISFNTKQNQEYILCQGHDLPCVTPTVFASSPNEAPKKLGPRWLGIGKGFEAGLH